jgi:hypothetical protein
MLNRMYLATGILMLGLYATAGVMGWEFGNAERQFVPADVRRSPGGYRAFHFWHSGYRGGK